jgi:hypothetical protein
VDVAPGSFFAANAGTVPGTGTPSIAGIQLPEGAPMPDGNEAWYWQTTDPVADAESLAGRLAAAFPETGLWPLLYAWEEHPSWDVGEVRDLDALDRSIDVGQVMRLQWETWKRSPWGRPPFVSEFPGLAEPPVVLGNRPALDDPFANLNLDAWPVWGLLLVPCHRPADVLAVLNWDYTAIPASVIAAVLRSWEERFAAVTVQVNWFSVTLHVGAPPTHVEQAIKLVAEFAAITNFVIDEDGAEIFLAETLVLGSRHRHRHSQFSPNRWEIGFRTQCSPELQALGTTQR